MASYIQSGKGGDIKALVNLHNNEVGRQVCICYLKYCRVPARWGLQQTTLGSGQRQDTGSVILWSVKCLT